MHPSEEIYCEKSTRLRGKTIILGITGSIAATECFGLIRELIRHGAKVVPVMTPAAVKLVAPDAIEFASGMKPIVELTGQTEHIMYMAAQHADLFMVYPATANTVSKIALGIDDTAVTSFATVALGSGISFLLAPAMHDNMYRNPAVAENLRRLESMGVNVVGPHREDGVRAKAATKDEMVAWAIRCLSRDDLNGKRMLVIGGRSEEPLDSMRIVTNRSTGLMSAVLAQRAFERGADVELWMGACNVPLPGYMPVKRFSSVSDLVGMLDQVDHDIVLVPAALADFAPVFSEGKISSDRAIDVEMNPVPKVLPLLCKRCANVIGFKAESGLTRDVLVARAIDRLERYGLKAVVANDVDSVGKTSTSALLVTREGVTDISGKKEDIADGILRICAGLK